MPHVTRLGVKVHKPELPAAGRQDPIAALAKERLGDQPRLWFKFAVELCRLQDNGTVVTIEIADRVIDRFLERVSSQPTECTEPVEPVEVAATAPPTYRRSVVQVRVDGTVVYYMRIGNRIKIGYSNNLAKRLAAINPEELMAFEFGDNTLEYTRHLQFRDLRTHGEWFRHEHPLAAHIKELQKLNPIHLRQ